MIDSILIIETNTIQQIFTLADYLSDTDYMLGSPQVMGSLPYKSLDQEALYSRIACDQSAWLILLRPL